MKLNEIRDNLGATHARKRVGRGIGSGMGKTSTRGHKGQRARGKVRIGFEGGQNPIYRRIPKRGFINPFTKNYFVLNLSILEQVITKGKIDIAQTITYEVLRTQKIIKGRYDGIALLAKGSISAKVIIEVSKASKNAVQAIENQGGKVNISDPNVAFKAVVK